MNLNVTSHSQVAGLGKHLNHRLHVLLRPLPARALAPCLAASVSAPPQGMNSYNSLRGDLKRKSIDPDASTSSADDILLIQPATVSQVHSPEQFQTVQTTYPEKLVILMCKASHCRPCKMFARKFERLAERFRDCIFLEIMGDETNDTKRMMMSLQVKVTPTFRLYRNGECVEVVTGIDENKLARAVRERLVGDEAGGNYCNLEERVAEPGKR